MPKFSRIAAVFCLLMSFQAFGAVFVVPDDAELVHKSQGIVSGVVVDAVGQARGGHVDTVYTVRVDRAYKGSFGATVHVVSPGGIAGGRMTAVYGSAHFEKGDRVLLFLTQDGATWTPTDMTLGKFRYVTSTGGQSLLVRDEEDIVGFDRQMNTHVEKIRREREFLSFVEQTVRGRSAAANYFVPPGETVSLPHSEETRFDLAGNSTYTPRSYAIHFNGIYPGRWPDVTLAGGSIPIRMSSSVVNYFYKNAAQSASGLGDGGVSMIQNAIAAWANDCPSAVNIQYGGTHPNLRHPDPNIPNDPEDYVNVVIWNDPGNHITGSWTGSGVIATAFMSGDYIYTFNGEADWAALSDSDVVVQNGLTGAESFVATAMTHEIGHAIGLRHANTHHDGTACQGTDECTTSAIMRSSVSTLYNYTLQSWDQNAIRALYPAICASTAKPYDFNADAKSDLVLRSSSTGNIAQWQLNGTAITLGAIIATPGTNWNIVTSGDFNGDGKADLLLQNSATGEIAEWQMNGSTVTGGAIIASPGTAWKPVATGDVNADGKVDIILQNQVGGEVAVWQMNGFTVTGGAIIGAPGIAYVVRGAGDFNNDGRTDIILQHSNSGLVAQWQLNGFTITSGAVIAAPAAGWIVSAIGDFNADSRSDIVLRNNSSGEVAQWQINGTAITTAGVVASPGTNFTVVGAGDYNGDGMSDLTLRDTTNGNVAQWQFNGLTITSGALIASPGTDFVPIIK